MTTSARETFLVRAPNEFAEIKGPEEWLGAYRYTRDLPSLLGLLHGGAQFTDDPRVLNVYLTYARLAEEYTDTVEFQVKKKARSIFYHEVLRRFHCPDYTSLVRWHPEEARNSCMAKADSLSKIFAFFDTQRSFPLGNPFENDVGSFMYGYASYLPDLMPGAQYRENAEDIQQDPIYEMLHQVVQALVAAITPMRWGGQLAESCEVANVAYCEALIRKVAGSGFAQGLVMQTLRENLIKILGAPRHPREILWDAGVERGGVARRLGLLLHDIEQLTKTPKTS